MLWALLVVPAAMLVIPRLVRTRREQAGSFPGWAVPLARLESAPRGRRRETSRLEASTGPLGAAPALSRFGLSTLGLVVLVVMVLGGALLLIARGWKV